ncbi:hypothetical protein PV327_004910 [Microctonus hyperodae]|uniref:AAA-ATPase-like domain-containing protein n=1 Tax=Microctonus hyperodae TaxID=165561 RepID=A0AA39FDF2_MICHY|nr:hypothetical protein PV327_004910 [Microctonus hyperodae]
MSGIKESTKTSSKSEKIPECINSVSAFEFPQDRPDYVDKTMLIKELIHDNNVLIKDPSRFDKTLNMDMVRRFVEIEMDKNGKPIKLDLDKDGFLKNNQKQSSNFKYFKGQKICNKKQFMLENFGKYPTINVDFSSVEGDSYKEVLDGLRTVLHKAFLQHSYLENSSLWDNSVYDKMIFRKYFDELESKSLDLEAIKSGLPILARYLYVYHGRPVFLFINECDVPMNSMAFDDSTSSKSRERSMKFLRKNVKKFFKGSSQFATRSLSNVCEKLGGILR